MKIGALIECRSTSTRLPGKCFLNVWTHGCARKQMINVVYDRVKMAKGLDEVVVVCPADDRALIHHCKLHRMECEPGPMSAKGNVMLEDLHCAQRRGWDVIVQITGDCPCIDWQKIDFEIRRLAHFGSYDFVADLRVKGAEVRVVRTPQLALAAEYIHGYQRDGTTFFYLKQPEWTMNVAPWQGGPDLSVDTKEDLDRVRSVLEVTGWDAPLSKILEAWNTSAPPTESTSSPTPDRTTPAASPSASA